MIIFKLEKIKLPRGTTDGFDTTVKTTDVHKRSFFQYVTTP